MQSKKTDKKNIYDLSEIQAKTTSEISLQYDNTRYLPTVTIEQNLFSIRLLLKSMFYCDNHLTYLISMFNGFQGLVNSTDEILLTYHACSHCLTLHLLKLLERYEIVEEVKFKKSHTSDLKSYISEIGKPIKKTRRVNMYDITFRKKRSVTKDDTELIARGLVALKIDPKDVNFKIIDGRIYLKAAREYITKNILTGKVLVGTGRCIKYIGTEIIPEKAKDVLSILEDSKRAKK